MLIFSKKYFLPLLLTLFYVTTTPSAPSTTIQLPKTKFNCGICNKNFIQNSSLGRHVREQHEQSAIQHTCSVCNETFLRHESLKSHQRIHTRKKIPCGNCEKSYAYESNLTRHQRDACFPTDHHTSPTINLCNTQFVPARELAQHRSIHKRKRTHSNKSPHPQGKFTDGGSQQPRLKKSKRSQKDLVTIVRGTRLMDDRVLPYHEESFWGSPRSMDEILTGACILYKVKNTYK